MSLSHYDKNKVIKLSIDNTNVDSKLIDFPVLVNLSTGSGQNNFDCTDLFTELEYHMQDDFTGTGGSTPNSLLWDTQVGTGSIGLDGNRLKFYQLDSESEDLYIPSKFKISGDFDIQIDFEVQNTTDVNWLNGFRLITDSDWYAVWFRRNQGANYYTVRKGADYAGRVLLASGDFSGKMRAVRVGTSLYGYYWSGLDWQSIGSPVTIETDDITVYLIHYTHGDNIESFYSYSDNFAINSGTIIWPDGYPTRKKIAIEYIGTQEHWVDGEFKSHLSERKQCYVEIENWDQANQEAQLWVKVPHVLSDQPTDLLLYYDSTQNDNTYYVGDTGDWASQQVWDDNFTAVYHLSQEPGSIFDSTSNEKTGSTNGSMDSNDVVDGHIGNALDFDGNDDSITIPIKPVLNSFTISKAVKFDINDVAQIIIDSGWWAATQNIFIQYTSSNVITGGVRDVGSLTQVTSPLTYETGVWYDITLTADGTDLSLYIDHNMVDSGTSNLSATSANNLKIAEKLDTTSNLDGKVDEVRISNIGRSSSWVKVTSYSNHDTLLTMTSGTLYSYSGYIYQYRDPVQREVYLYERNSGELMDKGVSNIAGYYSLYTTISGNHNVVCLDAAEAPDFEDLIISKITPTEVI
jgi:hypothetical protein